MKKVLFVCLGNICRSPTAEAVFREKVNLKGLSSRVEIDSAGTAAWHQGKAPDARSIQFAKKRGYDLSSLRARQVRVEDFSAYDYILAMDNENLENLKQLKPANFSGVLGLFLDYALSASTREVPDPYYGGDAGFDQVIDLVEQASDGLLDKMFS